MTTVFRDGPLTPGKSRILKIGWNNRGDRLAFMKNVRKLRPTEFDPRHRFSKIWARPDLTYRQRQADRALREELTRRKAEGETDIVIRKGVIVKSVNVNSA